jgi:protocatechuate 3,4-dioxygenase alpha subunit
MTTPATCSQTVGPYFSIGLEYRNNPRLCSPETPGEHLTVSGQVFDGAGIPVPDAQLELWQADAAGRFCGLAPQNENAPASAFIGFARVFVDEQGAFRFHTIRPGAVSEGDGSQQAPHIVVLLFMRGILKHLITRIYFEGDARNESDSLLLAVPQERRPTLVACPNQAGEYIWNIHLQGDLETVFFNY